MYFWRWCFRTRVRVIHVKESHSKHIFHYRKPSQQEISTTMSDVQEAPILRKAGSRQP